MERVYVVPEPKRLEFTGKWFKFDGFENFPKFIGEEFKVPVGGWRIVKVDRDGTGVKVKEGFVEVWGDEKVFYATLIQLILQGDGHIPEVTIEEGFFFKFRGFHLDIARGGVPKVETFKSIIRWLYLLKYNYFAVYVEDLFPWKSYPQIGILRGRLTEGEWNTIVDYGEKLGIEVFPSLELCGHMEHILSIPEFRRFSEWHRPMEGCLDVSNEEAREFAYRLLNEALELTRSKYVHIGGDETWALGRGVSLNKTWKFEGPSLYERHHKRLVEIARSHEKIPLLWGDMISGMYLAGDREKWAEVLQSDIWRDSIIANWDYSPESIDHFRRKIDIFKSRGLEQVACPGLSNWDRFYPNIEVAIANLRNFLIAAREKGILGFMVTAWGDDGEECLFSFLNPLILASMEIAEGIGEWEEKWMALTGESKDVLKARLLFGRGEVSDILKHALYSTPLLRRIGRERLEQIVKNWGGLLEDLKDVALPKDLEFIRRSIEVGLNKLRGKATVSDYIALARLYSELWLSERKPEGLELIVTRLWGAAGRTDLNLQ
ncbi:MAG: beta-N-acetylhexosaminidase [Candidatus Bathyarchaeia archaeon]